MARTAKESTLAAPWFVQEWARIRRDHQPAVRALGID